MHLVTEVSKGKNVSELAEYLSREFHGGYGIEASGVKYATWYAVDGIHIALFYDRLKNEIDRFALEG